MSHEDIDRRDFYRIDDRIVLKYRLLTKSEEEGRFREFEHYHPVWTTLHEELQLLDREQNILMQQIEQSAPDIGLYLSNLDRKVDLVTRLIASQQEEMDDALTEYVSMSASGIGFHAKEGIPLDSAIELRITLFPSHMTVFCYGLVVYSAEEDGYFQTGVRFSHLKGADKEALISHVLKCQSAQLQKQNNEEEFDE